MFFIDAIIGAFTVSLLVFPLALYYYNQAERYRKLYVDRLCSISNKYVILNGTDVDLADDVLAELVSARDKHPKPINSLAESYAVILEELDEYWDEVRKKQPDLKNCRDELIQIAAMAMRSIDDVLDKK